eukprot:TRINITY_DN49163_c0_g1_i1.p1 TRINITY_DN49163_c0_g1~~TRINITY_DN49163_c0_g1_i1.p1  ORF type:complete len:399 (-),score=42.53 TRINITY_DN49163_c0_g1_i1:28-1224(-)
MAFGGGGVVSRCRGVGRRPKGRCRGVSCCYRARPAETHSKTTAVFPCQTMSSNSTRTAHRRQMSSVVDPLQLFAVETISLGNDADDPRGAQQLSELRLPFSESTSSSGPPQRVAIHGHPPDRDGSNVGDVATHLAMVQGSPNAFDQLSHQTAAARECVPRCGRLAATNKSVCESSSPFVVAPSLGQAVGGTLPARLRGASTFDTRGSASCLSMARASTPSSSSSSWTAQKGSPESSTCSGAAVSDVGGVRWCGTDEAHAVGRESVQAFRDERCDMSTSMLKSSAVLYACREMARAEAARGRALLCELEAFRRSSHTREAEIRSCALRGAAGAAASVSGSLEEVAVAVAELGEHRAAARIEVGCLEAEVAGAAAGYSEARSACLAAERAVRARDRAQLK